MRWMRWAVLVLGCWGFSAPVLFGQTYNDRDFITQLYREYYQRYPSTEEINVWTQGLRRGDSLQEVQAAIMSSEEFFRRCGSNPNTWINSIFSILNNRNPYPDEFYYWSQRLQALRGDRRTLSREFLQNYGAQRPVYPTQLPSTPDLQMNSWTFQLQSTAAQLQQSIRQEFSGLKGSLLGLQASNLASVSASSMAALNNWRADPQAAARAANQVQRSLQSLNGSLQDVTWAPNSRYYLNQINQVFRSIAESVGTINTPLPPGGGGGVQYPPVYPPWNPSNPLPFPPTSTNPVPGTLSRNAASRLGKQLEKVAARANDTYFVVQAAARQDYRYSSLSSELGRLCSQLQRNTSYCAEGARIDLLKNDLSSTDAQFQRIDAYLRGMLPDVRVSESWSETSRTWDRFKSDALSEIGSISASGFPSNNPNLNSQVVLQQIDQLIAQCDVLLVQLNQMVLTDNRYNRLVRQVRDFRGNLVQLRQSYQLNNNPKAWQSDFESARRTLNQINQTDLDYRSNRTYAQVMEFNQLNTALQQLSYSLGM